MHRSSAAACAPLLPCVTGAPRPPAPPRLHVTLRDGEQALLRPLRPGDRGRLARGLARLSPEARYQRFLTPMPRLADWQLRYLTAVDQRDHVAWGALVRERDGWAGVGVGRWVRLDARDEAEFALTVLDEHQGRGLGRALLGVLAVVAEQRGVRWLRGVLLGENRRMARLLASCGAALRAEGGLVAAALEVGPLAERLVPPAQRRVIRRLARLAAGAP